jgi:hypothetical protein
MTVPPMYYSIFYFAASTMGFLRSPLPQVHLAEDDQLVQALAAQGADQTFRVTILPI